MTEKQTSKLSSGSSTPSLVSTLTGSRPAERRVTHKDEEALAQTPESYSSKFNLSPDFLHSLVESKDVSRFQTLGGLAGFEAALRTDFKSGLSADEDVLGYHSTGSPPPTKRHQSIIPIGANSAHESGFSDRRHAYSDNRLPPRKSRSYLGLVWDAFNDKLMFLLTFSAVISLSLGIYQSVNPSEPGSNVEWVEGVTIVIAIIIILTATATNDWQKNRKFEKLNRKKDEKFVNVVRSGKVAHISQYDILVGDLVKLETGDIVPADGILLQGFDVECDESSTTGESDLISKTPYRNEARADGKDLPEHLDPFILSGSKVANGVGTFVATAVGVNSSYGRILMSLRDVPEETPLQQKLGSLAKYILLFGSLFGIAFFFILFFRFVARLSSIEGGPRAKGESFLELFMLSVTMVVIGVPEGLALAVTLALAFATTRMLKDNNLVRLLRSCEIMGNATTICSDKTGTLTQNRMTVVSCLLGLDNDYEDAQLLSKSDASDFADERKRIEPITGLSQVSDNTRDLLVSSIVSNTTATEKEGEDKRELQGSSTEVALVQFAYDRLVLQNLSAAREEFPTVHLFPFQSQSKSMAAVVQMPNGTFRMFAKGAAEIIVGRCTHMTENETTQPLQDRGIASLHTHIQMLAERSLRVLAISYRDFQSWPPPSASSSNSNAADHLKMDDLLQNMTYVSVVGLRDPLRPDVIESVRTCQSAGVQVRMVTGDNIATAKAIAKDCGIYTPGGLAMDGPTFRKLTPAQLDSVVPRLQVLARSSPEDKRVLVLRLRAQREIVAVTGDGTNDALALKAADVGFAMAIAGTEVAKEASSIILMDDNFTSIVKAISWGRTVNDAVAKFLQFQLTINFSAGLLTAITALVGEVDEAVFTVVQLLWVNIIMDTFAALSLATDYPTKGVLQRKPQPRGQPIITVSMWKMILIQTVYQMAAIFVLHYAGPSIWASATEHEANQIQTTAFNTYIFMQLFNQTNCRTPDSRLNVFEGIISNPFFFFVQAVTVTGQVLIVMFGGTAFQTARPTGSQWGTSVILGILTLPLGTLVRCIPNKYFLKLTTPIRKLFNMRMRKRESKREAKRQRIATGEPPKPGFLKRAISVIKHETKPPNEHFIPTNEDMMGKPPVTEEDLKLHRTGSRTSLQRQNAVGEINLGQLIAEARQRNMATVPGSASTGKKYTFEVHPETAADDPVILASVSASDGLKPPPSQDPDHLLWLGLAGSVESTKIRRGSRAV